MFLILTQALNLISQSHIQTPTRQQEDVENEYTRIMPAWVCRCQKALAGLQVEAVILPDGEQFKSLDVLSKVWDVALEKRLNRKSTFIALGGGVIGDMTGFAAASYQRGVNFIQASGISLARYSEHTLNCHTIVVSLKS